MRLPHSVVLGVQWGGPEWPLLLAAKGQNLGNQGGRGSCRKNCLLGLLEVLYCISVCHTYPLFKKEWMNLNALFYAVFFFSYLLTYLAAPRGLSWGKWDLFLVERELLVGAYGILFPNQESNMGPLHWEYEVLAVGPPGKSHHTYSFFLSENNPIWQVGEILIIPVYTEETDPQVIWLKWRYVSNQSPPSKPPTR